MDGFQNGKFLFLQHFGTRLGVSLAAPKGISKWMDIKMASFLSFEILTLWYPLVFGTRLPLFACVEKLHNILRIVKQKSAY